MVNWLNRLTFPAGAENHKADGEDGPAAKNRILIEANLSVR